MAGGIVFAWIDEWFKKNWVVLEFEIPLDRNRLWYNRLDAEQHYGIVAMDAEAAVPGASLEDRLSAWGYVPALYDDPVGTRLRVAHDAAYLWLLFESHRGPLPQEVLVGFDLLRPEAGDRRWPGGQGPEIPVGVEFVLAANSGGVRLMVDPPQNPFRLKAVHTTRPLEEARTASVGDDGIPGHFVLRGEQRFNLPYLTTPNADGLYDSLRVVVNRRRIARDSTEFLAQGYDRGILPSGEPPDGYWQRLPERGVLEVRIPWTLLNFTDPSSRRVLQGSGGNTGQIPVAPFGTRTVDGIGIVVASREADGRWHQTPAEGGPERIARYSWQAWEAPEWRARPRPVYRVLAETFRDLDRRPGVAEADRDPAEGTEPASKPPHPGKVSAQDSGGAPGDTIPPGGPEVTLEALQLDADRAWREGEVERAERAYWTILEERPEDGRALHRLALMRAWAGEFDGSLQLFRRLLGLQPGNVDARVDRARVLAWRDDLKGAIDTLDVVLAEHPAHRGALEARAQFLAWMGDFSESLGTYDELLRITPRDAALVRSRARVLGFASEFDAAEQAYSRLLEQSPDDLEALTGLGRIHAWSGRLDESVETFRRAVSHSPENVSARQGLAQALSWQGNLEEGEAQWRRASELAPDNAESVAGLLQNLRWQGREAAAWEALQEASDRTRLHPDVREQEDWIRAALGPQIAPSLIIEEDSDDNQMVTMAFSAGWHPLPRLGIRLDGYRRNLSQNQLELQAHGAQLSASYFVEPGWDVTVGLGRSESSADDSDPITTLRVSTRTPTRGRANLSVGYEVAALDATATLADVGVELQQVSVNGLWTPGPGWRATASLGQARFRGTEDNTRWNGSARVSRRLSRRWAVGLGARAFTFEKDLLDGYFDPDFYGIADASVRWLLETPRFRLELEAAPGVQQVTSEGDLSGALRLYGRFALRAGPGREVSLSTGYSTTGMQSFSTGASDYRYTAVIVGGRWVF
jgi:tetratricopeptide (TPR) repeat protein